MLDHKIKLKQIGYTFITMDNLIELVKQLKENINNIPLRDRERKIVEYRFGLTDNTTHTLQETGKLFGVTRERIRQIEAKVLDIVRLYIKNK